MRQTDRQIDRGRNRDRQTDTQRQTEIYRQRECNRGEQSTVGDHDSAHFSAFLNVNSFHVVQSSHGGVDMHIPCGSGAAGHGCAAVRMECTPLGWAGADVPLYADSCLQLRWHCTVYWCRCCCL